MKTKQEPSSNGHVSNRVESVADVVAECSDVVPSDGVSENLQSEIHELVIEQELAKTELEQLEAKLVQHEQQVDMLIKQKRASQNRYTGAKQALAEFYNTHQITKG